MSPSSGSCPARFRLPPQRGAVHGVLYSAHKLIWQSYGLRCRRAIREEPLLEAAKTLPHDREGLVRLITILESKNTTPLKCL